MAVGLGGHAIADVGPVEPRQHHAIGRNAELLQDVGARRDIGGGRQRDARHARQRVTQRFELAIFGAEIMAPLADAMRFIDGDQRDLGARHQHAEPFHGGAFGRDIQQVELAIAQRADGGVAIVGLTVERPGTHAKGAHRTHLILHQRDQRRNHQRAARPHQRRDLVAQGFAGPRRHDSQHIAPGADIGDYRLLLPAKGGKAENRTQHIMGSSGGKHGRRSDSACTAAPPLLSAARRRLIWLSAARARLIWLSAARARC